MKQIILGLLTVFMAVVSQARDLKIVGQEFMPMQGSGADGKMTGVHYEIVKSVCEKLKWKCTYEVMPLVRNLEQLTSGEAQLALGLAKNPEREAIANIPGMVTQVGYTFFVKKGTASKYKTVNDFKGMTVGTHGGSATGKDLIKQDKDNSLGLKIVEETTAETPAKKLAGDRYGDKSAAYIARAVGLYQATTDKMDIEPVSFDSFLQSHTILVSKKGVTPEEFEQIKKAISEVMKTEKIKKLVAQNGLLIHPEQK